MTGRATGPGGIGRRTVHVVAAARPRDQQQGGTANMHRRTWRAPIALAAVAVLVMAACGGDDDNATATTAAKTDTTTKAASTATTAASGAAANEATTAGSTETTSAAGASGNSQMGLIDGVYKGGPDGFVIDPKDCPPDWNPKQGITDTDITFFTSMPKAGPLAGFGLIADGINSYFTYINDTKGGVAGHKLHLEVKDDGYVPDKTKTNVDEAIGENKYAGLETVIGTPNNLAIWDETNEECMPQLLNGTGAPQWGDIQGHPWTTGLQLDYASEAGLWVKWLQAQHPEAKTIAAVAYNNDFGKSYVNGFNRFIKGTDLKVVDQEYHEATAPDLSNQFTTMSATKADAVLVETSGVFCTQAMATLEKDTSWKPIVIMSGTCGSLSQFFQPLIDQGLTGAGIHIILTGKDVNDQAYANDDFVKLFHATAKAQGLDDKQTTYATGWVYAWYMVNVLEQAATYQGGLDRGNIALAARYINAKNPLVFDGIKQHTNGLKDAYAIEGGQMMEYKVTDPKQLGTFVKDGDLLDNDGGIGTYQDFLAGG
jgi:branched-chain amino acid transport system substrate-binding protein